ncbi:MAG: glycosyltransferase family 4 protein [Elusimicrobia bacterium]|nr:glycosyltransferase family 4 protein [Elusimicrobiota bacterium]
MGRIKVLHLITRLDFGGAQQNTLYTASHLDPARFDCLLVAGPGGYLDEEAKRLEAQGRLRVFWLNSLAREISPGRDLLCLLELINFLLYEAPQVVHTHSSKAGILGRTAAFLARIPVIVHTYHGFGFNDYQPHWRKTFYVLVERLCARMAHRLVFVSRANWNYARAHGLGLERIYRLIRSGIKLASFPRHVPDRAAKKAAIGVGKHKPLITSIGNLKPQKNPADFIAMAQRVSEGFPEAEFLFIGDGPLRRRLEFQIIASGLSHRLQIPGWRPDAAEILAVSDVFVMTSLWEGLPRALVEAMKSGLPCVCYATDGVRDLIEDGVNGFAVAPGNVSALAGRVSELLADEALRRGMGEAAARSIGPEFNIDGMVRLQESLYQEALSGAPAPDAGASATENPL